MKEGKSRITSTALAALAAAALPLAGYAQIEQSQQQTKQWERDDQQTTIAPDYSVTAPDRSRMSSSQVSKIDESELKRKLTAEELIGKEVIGNDGERIGKVEDIDLGSALAGQQQDRFSSGIGARQSSESDYGADATTSSRYSTTSRQETANAGSPTSPRSDSSIRSEPASPSGSAQTGTSAQPRDQQRNYENNQTAESGALSDPQRERSYGLSGFAEEISIYVSSENDELLEVPASFLSYNEQEDHLELDMSKAEIDALPEQTYSSLK